MIFSVGDRVRPNIADDWRPKRGDKIDHRKRVGTVCFVSSPGRKPLVRVKWDDDPLDERAYPPHAVKHIDLITRIGELDREP